MEWVTLYSTHKHTPMVERFVRWFDRRFFYVVTDDAEPEYPWLDRPVGAFPPGDRLTLGHGVYRLYIDGSAVDEYHNLLVIWQKMDGGIVSIKKYALNDEYEFLNEVFQSTGTDDNSNLYDKAFGYPKGRFDTFWHEAFDFIYQEEASVAYPYFLTPVPVAEPHDPAEPQHLIMGGARHKRTSRSSRRRRVTAPRRKASRSASPKKRTRTRTHSRSTSSTSKSRRKARRRHGPRRA
jgi:hypothetical protein